MGCVYLGFWLSVGHRKCGNGDVVTGILAVVVNHAFPVDPAKFVRIHRSFVMNLDRLTRVELDERENRVAILTDGRRLPVSRAGYARLSSLLAL